MEWYWYVVIFAVFVTVLYLLLPLDDTATVVLSYNPTNESWVTNVTTSRISFLQDAFDDDGNVTAIGNLSGNSTTVNITLEDVLDLPIWHGTYYIDKGNNYFITTNQLVIPREFLNVKIDNLEPVDLRIS